MPKIVGNKERTEFIENNIGLVRQIARKYFPTLTHSEDLHQAGLLGLIRALDRFDCEKGTAFSTYAAFYIRKEMQKEELHQYTTISLPLHVLQEIRKAYYEQNPEDRETPTIEVPVVGTVSLEEYHEEIEMSALASPHEIANRRMVQENLHTILSTLSHEDLELLVLRYGLKDGEMHTHREIGVLLGVSDERIRQKEKIILEKIGKDRKVEGLRG